MPFGGCKLHGKIRGQRQEYQLDNTSRDMTYA